MIRRSIEWRPRDRVDVRPQVGPRDRGSLAPGARTRSQSRLCLRAATPGRRPGPPPRAAIPAGSPRQLVEMGIDELRMYVHRSKLGAREQCSQKCDVVMDAEDLERPERCVCPLDCLLARAAMGDQLGNQRVVIHGDRLTFGSARIDPDPPVVRLPIAQQPPGLRKQSAGIFSVHTALDGVPSRRDVVLTEGSAAPAAISSCARTRSRPVMASVTGCSTCSLVFISKK